MSGVSGVGHESREKRGAKTGIGIDVPVEELAALAELHDEVKLLVVLEDVVELDDVGVVHLAHDGDLRGHGLELVVPVCRVEAGLIDRLHGNGLLGRLACRHAGATVLTRAEHLAQVILGRHSVGLADNVLARVGCSGGHPSRSLLEGFQGTEEQTN